MTTQITNPSDNVEVDGLINSNTTDLHCEVTWDVLIRKGDYAATINITIQRVEIGYTPIDEDGRWDGEFDSSVSNYKADEEPVSIVVTDQHTAWTIEVDMSDGLESDVAPKWVNVSERDRTITVGF